MNKVIEVVDTQIFKEKLMVADAVLPYVLSTLITQKAISKFLGVTPLTVANMIKDGRLKEGEHYFKDGNTTVFLPNAIIDYKINPPKKQPIPKEACQPSQEALNIIS